MFSLTDGEALEVFRGGLVTMFVVAVANKTLTTAQTDGLSATAAECRRRQPGLPPSPGCSLHRSRVAEAPRSLLRALADRRPIIEPLRRPPPAAALAAAGPPDTTRGNNQYPRARRLL